jgi:hypothetical protein
MMETKPQAPQRHRINAPREDWRNLILASTQEVEVIELVRDHMALWSPEEIVRLPEDCRPPRIRDAEDISRWAFELASTHCAQSGRLEDEALLDRMLEFVTQAAIRLSELQTEAPKPDVE